MGEASSIEWTDHTFNPWWGCTKVSPGCEHCYAETWAKRIGQSVWGPRAPRRFFGEKHWAEPLKWNREAERAETRRRVFCASMADVFEDREDLIDARARLFRVIEATTRLDWLLLTKRPENVHRLAEQCSWMNVWPENVWLGTTAEDQRRADERIPHLLATQAAVRFVSYEPALGPVDFAPWLTTTIAPRMKWSERGLAEEHEPGHVQRRIDWIIAGAESGARARPMVEQWVRDVRDQCSAAGVSFFYKQKLDGRGHKVSLPMLDGQRWAEFPT